MFTRLDFELGRNSSFNEANNHRRRKIYTKKTRVQQGY